MKFGHISISKGHVELNETEEETALREIKKETNLDVDLDTEFRHLISYSPLINCIKDVVFFVAKVRENGTTIPQECEVCDLLWKDFSDSVELLAFDSDKQTLKAAYEYLNAKE